MSAPMQTDDPPKPHQPSDHYLSLGDSYFVDEDYTSAVEAYTSSLSKQPTTEELRFRTLSHRSAAYLKLGRSKDALDDAMSALSVEIEINPFEEESFRRNLGTASFEMKQYERAKEAFERSKQIAIENGRNGTRYDVWIQKCDVELKDLETNGNGGGGVVVTTKEEQQQKPTITRVVNPTKVPPPTTMPKYQYYQSDTFVTIAILERNVKEENLKVDFELDKLTVILKKGGVDFTVICGTLFDAIDVSKCKVKIKDEKVLIKLKKKDPHSWHELFGTGAKDKEDENDEMDIDNGKYKSNEDADVDTSVKKEIPAISPSKQTTKPYSSNRDWDAIERDLKKQEENEKPEGEEALNKLFQQIYGKASEDTKRAMIKSFQTSGGTVLSTNWDEVSKTDYERERQAPKGMEWKNWEGEKLPQKED